MTSKVGSLIISLALESGAFKSGLTNSEKELKAATKRMQAVGQSMKNFGQTMSLAVTLPFAALAKSSIDAAVQSKDALAQVQQGIQSMGNAAGRSVEQLQALASKEMFASLYDDDDILRQVSATLLTFGNVTGSTFDTAQQAIVDLSAKLGQDLQSSAIQVGKALNDPVKGITALQRVGVSFTEQQKDQIKAMVAVGDAAGAQKIILDELAREFGGAAQAAANANPFTVLKHAMDDFKEAVGAVLLKALPPLLDGLTSVLRAFTALPQGTQTFIVGIGLAAAAMGPLSFALGTVVRGISGIAGALSMVTGAGGGLAAARAGFMALAASINPVSLLMTGLVAGFGYVIYKTYAARDATGIYAKTLQESGAISQKVEQLTQQLANAHGKERESALQAAKSEAELTRQKIEGAKRTLQLAQAELARAKARMAETVLPGADGNPDAFMAGQVTDTMMKSGAVNQAQANIEAARQSVNSLGSDLDKLNRVISAGTGGGGPRVANIGAGGGGGGGKGGGGGGGVDAFTSALKGLMDQLLPAEAALREFNDNQKLLNSAYAKGKIDLDHYIRALEQLRTSYLDQKNDQRAAPDELIPGLPDLGAVAEKLHPLQQVGEELRKSAIDNAAAIKAANTGISDSFRDMANNTLYALRDMVGAIQGGGFLDILQTALNAFAMISQTGLFGGKLKTAFTPSMGSYGAYNQTFRARGGPVNEWTPYVVGERGPELFIPGANGRIVPNHALSGGGGPSNIQIVPSQYFDVVVDGRVMQAAPAIVNGGARLAQAQLGASQFRRLG